MIERPRHRFVRFVGALTAIVLIGGTAALAASVGVTSRKLTVFTKAGPPAVGDTTPPALQTLEMFDTDTNGFIDEVVATFDETLQTTYTAGNTPWTLASVPSSRTLSSVAVSGMKATLSLGGGTTSANTASGLFTVKLDAATGGVRDAAGNRSSFAARSVTDKAGPVPTVLAIENGGATPGKAEKNDRLRITYSEKLAVSTMCSTWSGNDADQSINAANQATVTLKNEATSTSFEEVQVAAVDTKCALGFRFGTLRLNSRDYVPADVSFGGGGNDKSSIAWSASTAQLLVTLGITAGSPNTVAAATPATYTPSASITDVLGNAAAGSATKPSSVHF